MFYCKTDNSHFVNIPTSLHSSLVVFYYLYYLLVWLPHHDGVQKQFLVCPLILPPGRQRQIQRKQTNYLDQSRKVFGWLPRPLILIITVLFTVLYDYCIIIITALQCFAGWQRSSNQNRLGGWGGNAHISWLEIHLIFRKSKTYVTAKYSVSTKTFSRTMSFQPPIYLYLKLYFFFLRMTVHSVNRVVPWECVLLLIFYITQQKVR